MPEPQRPLKVFLSYASQDRAVVRELSGRLASEVWIDPWVDEKKLLPGQDWRLKIEEAVETSDIVIICLSTNSVSKEGYVQKELRYAREIAFEKPEETIFLVPLRLDECAVPRGLRFFQWVDYFGEKKDEGYDSLIESLKMRYEQKLKIEEEERARKEKAEKERVALENKARKEAEEKARLESEERARLEIEERERIALEAKARKEAEERARSAKEENDRKNAEIAEQEKEKREVAEKAKRERIELESVEKASQEKAKLQAIEKAKREREERHAAQIAALKETFSRSFATLKSNPPKAKPLLRNVGLAGIAVVLFWFGKLEIPKLASLVPTANASLTPTFSPSVTFTFIVSPQLLTKTLTPKPTPTFTPTLAPTAIGGGAGKIAFTSERDGYQEIYVMNSDGSDLIKLKNSITPKGDPAWSPDGRQIAFGTNNDNSASLYVMNADGSNPTKLIDTKGFSDYSQVTSAWRLFGISYPTWSPNGKKIAFRYGHYVNCCSGHSTINVINTNGSNLISVKGYGYDNIAPAWSPDSQKIAFDSDSCGGSWDICVMNANGTNLINLTNKKAGDWYPSWSPDGKKIAFISSRNRNDSNYSIYVMNADGINPINLTPYLIGGAGSPMWSPDGKKIVFASPSDGDDEIYVINADGTNLANLTNNQAPDDNPVWSPDSQQLLLSRSAMGTLKST